MVVLDQDRIVEAEPVIDTAARPHRIFFKSSQSGSGFAGATDPGAGAGNRVNNACGGAGNAGQMAQKVKRHSLTRNNRTRVTLNHGNHITGLNPGSVRFADRNFHVGVHQPECSASGVQPRDDPRLACAQNNP